MSRALRIDPADPRPIWRQIEESVRHLVASGALAAGAPVPSVRDLARDLQVNPATGLKAYQRLTDAGVLAVRAGRGDVRAATRRRSCRPGSGAGVSCRGDALREPGGDPGRREGGDTGDLGGGLEQPRGQ